MRTDQLVTLANATGYATLLKVTVMVLMARGAPPESTNRLLVVLTLLPLPTEKLTVTGFSWPWMKLRRAPI